MKLDFNAKHYLTGNTQTKWVGRFAGKERSKYKSKVTKVEKLRIGEFRDLGIRGFRKQNNFSVCVILCVSVAKKIVRRKTTHNKPFITNKAQRI